MNHAAELLVGVLFVFLVGRLSWLAVWVIELSASPEGVGNDLFESWGSQGREALRADPAPQGRGTHRRKGHQFYCGENLSSSVAASTTYSGCASTQKTL
jgi:hypothetical protein